MSGVADPWSLIARLNAAIADPDGHHVLSATVDGDLIREAIRALEEMASSLDAVDAVSQVPVGPRYCTAHAGMREEDESGGCDFREDDSVDDCQFHDLFPGADVVDTYHDPFDDDEDGES